MRAATHQRFSATRIAGRTDVRRCTACKDPKPATSEHFRPSPDGPDGFRTQCRVCENTKQRKQQKG